MLTNGNVLVSLILSALMMGRGLSEADISWRDLGCFRFGAADDPYSDAEPWCLTDP